MAHSTNPLQTLLSNQGYIVLDGGLATELERQGVDLSTSSLWSASLLLNDPAAIVAVHRSYFRAGADIAITASYQASTLGLQTHAGLSLRDAQAAIRKSVELAQQARAEVLTEQPETSRTYLVAGSVGPYGAYLANGAEYTGDYALGAAELKDFHRPRIQALTEAGCDLLALETMPSFAEIRALVELLAEEFPRIPAWVSLSLRTAEGVEEDSGGEFLADGSPLADVIRLLSRSSADIVAMGFNCGPPQVIDRALAHVRELMAAEAVDMPLLAYPNSGELYDASAGIWSQRSENHQEPESLAVVASRWYDLGVKIIGGCCRTTPMDIEKLKAVLDSKGR